jgi:hypothetical protein
MRVLSSIGLSVICIGLAACNAGGGATFKHDLPPAGASLSRAYKEVMDKHYTNFPPKAGECSREIHAQYWTYGPDGKVYPTWHPPVDPDTGCAFGHEHGTDPSGSNLVSIGLPFGYTNEKLFEADSVNFRDEDHVGHKVEWQNSVVVENRVGSFAGREYARCDFLIKLHQGTHSADALTNNLHELFYYSRCSDGTAVQFRTLNAFGDAGKVHRNCSNDTVASGTPVPANSPNGGGNRDIPDATCVDSILVAPGQNSDFGRLNENWPIGLGGWAEDGKLSFNVSPYFQVRNPSRFTDLSQPNKIGRPIDLCYAGTADKMARGKTCDTVRAAAPAATPMAYDDPRSPFNGTNRTVDINNLSVNNATGNTKWFTDAFGKNIQRTADPSKGIVVEQFISKGGTTEVDLRPLTDNNIGGNHNHPTVHAPN